MSYLLHSWSHSGSERNLCNSSEQISSFLSMKDIIPVSLTNTVDLTLLLHPTVPVSLSSAHWNGDLVIGGTYETFVRLIDRLGLWTTGQWMILSLCMWNNFLGEGLFSSVVSLHMSCLSRTSSYTLCWFICQLPFMGPGVLLRSIFTWLLYDSRLCSKLDFDEADSEEWLAYTVRKGPSLRTAEQKLEHSEFSASLNWGNWNSSEFAPKGDSQHRPKKPTPHATATC